MDVVELPLEQIIPYARNPRRNEQAIATVAASIQEFGWRQPIVVDEAMVVLAGHTRLEAARKLGFKTVPVHVAKGLTVSQARALRIMDNRSSENAEWDMIRFEIGSGPFVLFGVVQVLIQCSAQAQAASIDWVRGNLSKYHLRFSTTTRFETVPF